MIMIVDITGTNIMHKNYDVLQLANVNPPENLTRNCLFQLKFRDKEWNCCAESMDDMRLFLYCFMFFVLSFIYTNEASLQYTNYMDLNVTMVIIV